MNRLESLPPAFDFSAAPDPVRLFQGNATLVWQDHTHAGEADVLLRFLPTPRVVIQARFQMPSDVALSMAWNDSFDPAFALDGQRIDGFGGKRRTDGDCLELAWNPGREPLERGDAQSGELVCVVSHLFNFPDFRGGRHAASKAGTVPPMLVLDEGDWRISIHALPGKMATAEAWNRIREEGGCFLTHVMKLEHKNDAPFSVAEAKKQIIALTHFLSLVKGSSLWAVCDVGLDAKGNRIWESFCAPRLGNPPYSWADRFHGHQVEVLFPLFAKRWKQSDAWRDCLDHAIYWYNQANTGDGQPGIDSAMILVQAALERLAHHHAVVDRKMISAEGFKGLKASDKFRMLFSSLSIPMDIPASMSAIQNAAKRCAWVDAPHAITDIRNSLVHPDTKKRVKDCYFEAWKLSLWYLELSILAMCGYKDTYQSRLTATHVGQVEQVPWNPVGGQA